MDALREEMANAKVELVDAHTSKLAAQAQAFSEQIEKINAAQAEALEALERKHAEAMADVEARLANALEQTESTSAADAHANELAALNEEHTKTMEELEREYKSQITDLENELAEMRRARAETEDAVRTELVEEHSVALEEQKSLLSSAFAADIRNAEKKLAAAREEISRAKSAASAEFSAAGTAQAQIRKLHEEMELKDAEIAKLERKLAANDNATADGDAHAKSDARLDSAKAARKRAEERAQEMEAKVTALMHDVDEANKSSQATRSKYSTARSRIESLEVALHAAKTEIAQLKGIEPPPSVSKTPARTPAVKRPLAGRTPGKTPGTMGTARRILSDVNADEPPSSPSLARPNKHMRFDTSPPAGERAKPIKGKHRAELEGIRRGTGRLLSKPAMRVQSAKPADE